MKTPKMSRLTIDAELCKECEYCLHFCPSGNVLAKSRQVNKKGYFPVMVQNSGACTACATCAICCPEGAITVESE